MDFQNLIDNAICTKKPTCDDSVNTLLKELRSFQSRLSDNQELMIKTCNLTFRLEVLRYEHDTLVFQGSTAQDTPVVLVQHYHQLNVLFFAAPKRTADIPAVRIGFHLD